MLNNTYSFSFSTGIIYHFNIVLPNRNEVVQQFFKSRLSYNEILSVLSTHHNVSLSIRHLKRILKSWVYREERQKCQSTMLLFFINKLESSSRCLGFRAMHQKLLMNGFIIDQKSVFDFERTWSFWCLKKSTTSFDWTYLYFY